MATVAVAAAVAFASAPGAAHAATRPALSAPVSVAAPAPAPVRGAAGAAAWLARQFRGPFLPTATPPPAPNYSGTAQAVLALAAIRSHGATVAAAMTYLEDHVRTGTTTTVAGRTVGNPGVIAYLMLDAHATGGSARRFGGVNLVNELMATMRTAGPDAGLFGAAAPTFDGAYRQGLSLAALAGVAVAPRRVAPAVGWLQRQQCRGGGWEAYRANTAVACGPTDPATFSGPDTNSTALAVEGLRAQNAAIRHSAFAFLLRHQDGDGGWGYQGAPSDPDSTAVVRQALVALHEAHSRRITRSGGTPLSALLHFQLTSGHNAGAVTFPGSFSLISAEIATEQAAPALAGLALPLAKPSAST